MRSFCTVVVSTSVTRNILLLFGQTIFNGYTEIFNGFDLELIIYDQIYYNLTIGIKKT